MEHRQNRWGQASPGWGQRKGASLEEAWVTALQDSILERNFQHHPTHLTILNPAQVGLAIIMPALSQTSQTPQGCCTPICPSHSTHPLLLP